MKVIFYLGILSYILYEGSSALIVGKDYFNGWSIWILTMLAGFFLWAVLDLLAYVLK